MDRLSNYKGSVEVPSGLKPLGDFPLMEAHDIVVDESGKRLDEKIDGLVEEVIKSLPIAEEVSV